MTPDQVKVARALLGWSLDRLAARSGTSVPMVTAFEQTGRVVFSNGRSRALPVDAVAAVRTALEQAGVEFIEQNGGGPGVRLRMAQSSLHEGE